MLKYDLGVWASQECPSGATHFLNASFADPEFDTQATSDLFCYNQNTGTGGFFATVKKDPFGDGTLVRDERQKVWKHHAFGGRWTHMVYIPLFVTAFLLPQTGKLLLFYDATSGVAEVYESDGNGNLKLKKQYSGWRTSWTQIIGGQFGTSNLLFYDATNRVGEFYTINNSGDIQFIEGWE